MKPEVYPCVGCGADIPQKPGPGRVRRFCSPRCNPKPKEGPCSVCGCTMHLGKTSLPAEKRTCLTCRRARKAQASTPICQRCGAEFTPTMPRQKLCRKPCQPRLSGSSSNVPWSERGYGADHVRERARRLAMFSPGDPCARCGGPLPADTSLIHLDHTDDRSGYLGLSHAACNCGHTSTPRPKRPKVCDHCGLTYLTRLEGQLYCSQPCRRAANQQARRLRAAREPGLYATAHPCPTCGMETKGRKYCRPECRPSSYVARPRVIVQCETCGGETVGTKARRYCSKKCRPSQAAYRSSEAGRAARRAQQRRWRRTEAGKARDRRKDQRRRAARVAPLDL